MAKYTSPLVLDAALTKVATATRMTITSAQPANFAGIAAVLLASAVQTAGVGGASYSALVAGDVSGRKVTVAAKNAIPITASGNATHVNLDDGVNLLHCTTVTTQAVTSGNTANVGAYDVEFADVTP